MKILIDMNLSPLWEIFFTVNNIEARHWSKIGKAYAPDTEIFLFAQNHDFIVFTNDLDFGNILAATNAQFPSVFQLKSQELMPELIGQKVLNGLEKYKNHLLSGSLVTLNMEKERVRILPLRS